VEAYVRRSASRSELERRASKEKTGVWTGAFATNPATGEQIPVWIADYVLHGYGTGAIMAVPAHDERDWAFARAMSLPVREVVSGGNVAEAAYAGEGTMVNSGPLDGVTTRGGEAVSRAVAWLEERSLGRGTVTYSLRDWAFARQRYWGEPIPVLKDEHGELVRALGAAERVLKPGGRLVIVTFHSIEDRIVKLFLRSRSGNDPGVSRHVPRAPKGKASTFEVLQRKATEASEAETSANPRSRSARLRWALRTDAPAWESGPDEGFRLPGLKQLEGVA
jgi:hypothetical protein